MTLNTQQGLVRFLAPRADKTPVQEVRIGLGYTAVVLGRDCAGLAWTPKATHEGCAHMRSAGSLAGRPAAELLSWLEDPHDALSRAIGLATANALIATAPSPHTTDEQVLALLNLGPKDRVAMVGYFAPVIAKIEQTGCALDVIELNQCHLSTLSPEQGREALRRCTVAIITGTALVTGTIDDVLASLGEPRAAILLGPSSPLVAEPFLGTKLTHVAGSRVIDVGATLRVVGEGGGTPALKPHLRFLVQRLSN
ncbi:MAG: DUF364 domain-containing protein [Myxococcota bacterium]|jgi:hypothetical protein|nr:DUF364 domain-containing protein [Myxococcota bacterium]